MPCPPGRAEGVLKTQSNMCRFHGGMVGCHISTQQPCLWFVAFVHALLSICLSFCLLQGKLLKKERPHVDPRYKTRSFAESKLVEIMEETWTFDPTERIRYVFVWGGCFVCGGVYETGVQWMKRFVLVMLLSSHLLVALAVVTLYVSLVVVADNNDIASLR
jgi:hypothetical protein